MISGLAIFKNPFCFPVVSAAQSLDLFTGDSLRFPACIHYACVVSQEGNRQTVRLCELFTHCDALLPGNKNGGLIELLYRLS